MPTLLPEKSTKNLKNVPNCILSKNRCWMVNRVYSISKTHPPSKSPGNPFCCFLTNQPTKKRTDTMKHILLCGVYLQNCKVNLLFQSFSEKVRIDRRDLNLYRHIGNFWMHKCFLVFFANVVNHILEVSELPLKYTKVPLKKRLSGLQTSPGENKLFS